MNRFKILVSGFLSFLLIGVLAMIVLLIYYQYDNPIIMYPVVVGVFLIDVVFAFYILISNRYTYTKLTWVCAILALPLLGCILFLIFGTTPFNKKDWREFNVRQKEFIKHEIFYSKQKLRLTSDDAHYFNYVKNNSFRPIYNKNKISIINANSDLYWKSIKLIRSAKNHIHIQMYIMRDGIWLRTLVSELIKKVQQGVKVRIIYDWYGCLLRFPKKLIKYIKANGIEIANFNPHGINMFKGATNFRSHRKVIIVDNKKALYGGSNIGNEYLAINKKTSHFKDLNFIVEGQIVNSLNLLFCEDFCFFTDVKNGSQQYKELYNSLDKILVPCSAKNKLFAQVVDSSPDFEGKSILNLLISVILKAKKSIQIVTPYFFPPDSVIDAIIIASQAGVKVSAIFPEQSNNKSFITTLNRSFYKKLINANVKIYEYNGFIHQKSIVIDGEYILSGSFNLDTRSLWINFESAILFKNKDIALQLIHDLEHNPGMCKRITKKDVAKFATRRARMSVAMKKIYFPLL